MVFESLFFDKETAIQYTQQIGQNTCRFVILN